MTNLFCFGLGYSATAAAKRLAARGWRIAGTSTTAEGAARIAALGYHGAVFDGRIQSEAVARALKSATHVLLSIPPDGDGDPAYRAHAHDLAASRSLTWIGYFSTVGVYGDAGGGWVDENTPARPASERGRRRLESELAWARLGQEAGKTVTIFRLPGIYGPGRSAIEDLRSGTARRIIKPGQVFNRIHVDDIAVAVEAAALSEGTGGVYNVTDDLPAPPQDVVAYGAELLGLPCPPDLAFATAELSPMARSFYSESKRVANARIKAELGLNLQFPTYREGLAAIAAQQATD
jgi:nucleoside-diphosphate-sugar epimerase